MATFQNKTFSKYDEWYTPKSAWEDIQHLIPKKKIWEAFYGDGKSGNYLKELGFEVIHEDVDFFEKDYGELVVSNPPFTKVPEVLERLVLLEKPFILIMPSSKINTQYFRKLFCNKGIQIIIPKKRIQFDKLDKDTDEISESKKACNFDCFYYCWKIGLPQDIVWL